MRQFALILVSLLFLGGCAHKRYLEEGDDYLSTGEYEVAVDKYQQALERKPNHKETKNKLTRARVLFDSWIAQLEQAAVVAEQNQQLGKAFILYAKLAKHSQSHEHRQKANALFQNMRTAHRFSLHLSTQTEGLRHNGQLHQDIHFSNQPVTPSINSKNVDFSLDNIQVEITESTEMVSVPFISHYETIANPEHQDILREIDDQRMDIKSIRADAEIAERKFEQLNTELKLYQKDQEILELRLQQVAGGSTQSLQLKSQLEKVKRKIATQLRIVKEADDGLNALHLRLKKREKRLDELHLALKDTPELAEEPVYADYEYPVLNTHQKVFGTLRVRINNTVSEKKVLSLTLVDTSHDAHDTIELQEDPLILQSKEALSLELIKDANQYIDKKVRSMLSEYQQRLLTQASRDPNLDGQLNTRIIAGVIAKEGLPRTAMQRAQHQLSLEFGNGGRFRINELLARFR